ncbi:MMPL family transporter [Streptomyces apocyni]|uniref:MMPL family transporter n=1 Tax=Streptomyces apocyni TaxID=2654677 RepID=UPI0012EAD240|nr:MMPL family transporter [Streptomyces apocyni]
MRAATDRRRRALPWAVLALWIAVLALAAPFAGKLGDIEENGAIDYLPASADSTQVAMLQQELPGGEATELVLVYQRDGKLTGADQAVADAQVAEIAAAHELTARPRAVESTDGTTLMYPVSTTEPGGDEELRNAFVEDVRAAVSGEDGMSVQVGGPGALQTDMEEVFATIDGTLMIATALVVTILLILTYRSPFLWLIPLVGVAAAALTSRALIYALVEGFGMDLTVSGQTVGVMTVLVFGAGTDYALLIVARYREELRRIERPYEAMLAALRGCGPAVLASSGTVAAGLLCLLAADLNSSSGLGPVGAIGVLCALVAMLTLLPALLVLLGRRVFWPLIPEYGVEAAPRRSLFAAMGGSAGRRPVAVLVSGVVLLGAMAMGAFNLPGNLRQEDSFTSQPESVAAMEILADAYPERGSQPIAVLAPTDEADRALNTARSTDGVATAERGRTGDNGWSELKVFAKDAPETPGETATIERLRDALDGSYVGGPSAQQVDLEHTNARDRLIVMPLLLAAVLLILILLLRSLVAPLMLVGAVVLVWASVMGLGGLLFEPVFGFAGVDPSIPLLSFVFLVALGVDYGIFLMHRMREEALTGAEPRDAALTALRTTGGVIASAGVVLAATFMVLLVLPLVMLREFGFLVAVGVLLDTFLVRTYLVTSASMLLKRRVWWPGPLSKDPSGASGASGTSGMSSEGERPARPGDSRAPEPAGRG